MAPGHGRDPRDPEAGRIGREGSPPSAVDGRGPAEMDGHRLTLPLDGITWSYLEGGTGDTVVFLHGAVSLGQVWTGAFPRLAARHRVILPDLPGFGDSEANPPLETLADVIAALDPFLDAVAPSPFTLVGNSLGGTLATLWTRSHPQRLRGLVLVAPAGLSGGAEASGPAAAGSLREMNSRLFSDVGRARGNLPHFSVPQARMRWARARSTTRRWLRRGIPPISLEDLPVPIRVIWGTEDRILPYAEVLRAMEGLPGGTLVPLADCGHLPQWDCPEAFVAAVEDFLRGSAPPPGVPRP